MSDEKILTRIADLYYLQEIDLSVIADKFNFSISKVSRMLKEAREKKIIEFKIKNLEKDNYALEKLIEETFGLKEALIYSDLEVPKYDEEMIFQEVGKTGARYLERILKDSLNIFVCGGKTLYSAFKNIKIDKKLKANIYATLGGLNLKLAKYESNRLAQLLSEKIGGTCYPMYLPLILKNINYKGIMVDEHKLDQIVTNSTKNDIYIAGISTVSIESRMFTLGSFDLDFINSLKEKNIIGEVGMNFYDINGNFIKSEIDERIVKLHIDEILKIRNRIIMAFGREKILPLKGLLKTHVPTVLITDEATAIELLK